MGETLLRDTRDGVFLGNEKRQIMLSWLGRVTEGCRPSSSQWDLMRTPFATVRFSILNVYEAQVEWSLFPHLTLMKGQPLGFCQHRKFLQRLQHRNLTMSPFLPHLSNPYRATVPECKISCCSPFLTLNTGVSLCLWVGLMPEKDSPSNFWYSKMNVAMHMESVNTRKCWANLSLALIMSTKVCLTLNIYNRRCDISE